jgi:hypothetical protein
LDEWRTDRKYICNELLPRRLRHWQQQFDVCRISIFVHIVPIAAANLIAAVVFLTFPHLPSARISASAGGDELAPDR